MDPDGATSASYVAVHKEIHQLFVGSRNIVVVQAVEGVPEKDICANAAVVATNERFGLIDAIAL